MLSILFKLFTKEVLSFVIPMFKFEDDEPTRKMSEALDVN